MRRNLWGNADSADNERKGLFSPFDSQCSDCLIAKSENYLGGSSRRYVLHRT
jgi:hypothetical protein